MKLYVTPQGQWVGTKADAPAACREEGSAPGSWKMVDVPVDKPNLLLFLNKGWKQPEEEKPVVRVRERPAPSGNGTQRWRVLGGLREKLFVSSVRAATAEEACAQVAETLEAYVPGG